MTLQDGLIENMIYVRSTKLENMNKIFTTTGQKPDSTKIYHPLSHPIRRTANYQFNN
jgi:hypothetical protein